MSKTREMVHKLYHVSRTKSAIDEFQPFSHFGTAKAALDRGRGPTVASSQAAWFHEVQLVVCKFTTIPDIEQASHSPVRLADLLHYDIRPKLLTSAERDAVLWAARASESYDPAAGYVALSKILMAKGCAALAYQNLHEDFGSTAWIAVDPSRVSVLRSVSLERVLEELDRAGTLPDRGLAQDPQGVASRAVVDAIDTALQNVPGFTN